MRLLLADVAGYLFRAFHAVGDLRTSGGLPTGAVYGVVAMLAKLRRQYPPDFVACVMDAPGKNFRHQLYPQYKANRPPIHPDIATQIPAAKAFIEAAGWNLVCQSGVEADDVIATLARRGQKANMEVIIASSDKDLMQLVGDGIVVFDSMRGMRYDEKAVKEKFGVPPAAIGDFLALTGDSSDNIRGVEKVGPKTAAKWLDAFGSLNGIVKNAGTIGGKIGEYLRAAIDNGDLSLARKLVSLKEDVPTNAPETMQPQPPDIKQWRQLCQTHEFTQHATMLEFAGKQTERMPAAAITDEEILIAELAKAHKSKTLAIDTETIGKPAMMAKIIGFSFCADGGRCFYVPLAHSDDAAGDIKQLPQEKALAILSPYLADGGIRKIAHNGKYDMHIFANCGLHCGGVWDDTKIAAYVMEPSSAHSMPALAKRHLHIDKKLFGDLVGKKDKASDFSNVPIPAATEYAAEDAEAAWKLGEYFFVKHKNKAGRKIYEDIDRPLMPILAKMERAGMRIDSEELGIFAAELRARMTALEDKATTLAGHAFNLNAPRQLEEVLFDQMGAPAGKRTATKKARSTGEEVLESLCADYPLAQVALEHRTAAKLLGTYAEALPRAVNPQTGRIHCDFNQTMAATGRLSSNSPNLQNIPARSAEGRRIRRAFIAADGMQIASADYSQIELRLMAHFSGDDNLRAAFARGDDIHRQTAAEVFHITPLQVNDNQRRAAKAINFGLIYGMSAFGLSRALGVSRAQAQSYIDRYFSRYPGVADYMERTRAAAKENGFVKTAFGRRLPTTLTARGQQAAARAAINAPMQGSAADLIKIAMLAADKWLTDNKMKTRMVSQVHDELLLEVARGEADAVFENLPSIMCAAQSYLSVPLAVDMRMGDNWDAAK